MAKAQINLPAPDFSLINYQGDPVTLSTYKGQKNVLLVFNRGFM